MNTNKEELPQPKPEQPALCLKCKQFWGSSAYEGLCSKCYDITHKKDKKKEEKIAEPEKKELTGKKVNDTMKKGPQQNKNRCFDCRKKVGLLGIECKCGYVYCNTHRLPEDHACDFNHEEEGKDKLKKEIVKVAHEKIEEM